MGADPPGRRRLLLQLRLDQVHIPAASEAGAVGDPEDMGVDREGLLAERDVHDDVGGLAPDPGQRLQRVAVARHLAAMLLDQGPGESDDVLRLGVEQADRPDVLLQAFLAERKHLLRRGDLPEQVPGGAVHARVGRLGGEDDGDEQGIGVDRFQLGLRIRGPLREPAVE